jgi:hypothetical protein
MQTEEVLDDSISVLVFQHFHRGGGAESEDGLPVYWVWEMMRRKEAEVILTMIVMSRLMMNFSRRELIHSSPMSLTK